MSLSSQEEVFKNPGTKEWAWPHLPPAEPVITIFPIPINPAEELCTISQQYSSLWYQVEHSNTVLLQRD